MEGGEVTCYIQFINILIKLIIKYILELHQDMEILFTGLTKDDACNKEIELIAFYKSSDKAFGYNMTTGGECCHMTEEAKQKLSKALMGNKNGFGKPCSKEKAEKNK